MTTQGTQNEEKHNKNNPEKMTTQRTQDEDKQTKNTTQSRENDNIGYTRRRQTIQKHNTLCVGHQYTQTKN